MKRFITFTLLAFVAMVSLSAQDLITKKDGTDIKAKILEVNKSELKYKLWSNLDGPTYLIDISEILLVRYENGTNEVFNSQNTSSPKSSPATRSAISDSFHRDYFAKDISRINPKMKFQSLKSYYDADDFTYLGNPAYSPSRAWMNLAFPGLAQFTMGENDLGALYLGLGTIGTIMMGIPIRDYLACGYFTNVGRAWFVVGSVLCSSIEVISILNAVKVAKVKSLYIADMEKLDASYSFTACPVVLPTYSHAGIRPIPGFSQKVTF